MTPEELVQLPVVAVRVCVSRGVPLIVGGELLPGGSAATTEVGLDVELVLAAAFVAVTTTRIVEPMSAPTSVYVDALAPAMFAQFAPALSQRRH